MAVVVGSVLVDDNSSVSTGSADTIGVDSCSVDESSGSIHDSSGSVEDSVVVGEGSVGSTSVKGSIEVEVPLG